MQEVISKHALIYAEEQRSTWLTKLHGSGVYGKLRCEVRGGKTLLIVNEQGDIERIVPVVALELIRDDGRVLFQLGKLHDSHIEIQCQLPSFKQGFKEDIEDVILRIFETRLFPVEDSARRL